MATVLAAWTHLVLDYAAARGVPSDDVLAPAAVPARALSGERVAELHDRNIWAAAAQTLGDDDLGVHLSETVISARSLGVLGVLAQTAPTVDQALAVGARYHRLIKENGEVAVVRRPEHVVVHDWPGGSELPAAQRRWPRALAETIIANYVTLARQWTGHCVAPVEVSFQHARPADVRELERFFACPLRFEAPTNSLVIDRDTAALPLLTWSEAERADLEELARRELLALGGDDLADVLAAISELLDRGDLDITRVARQLATSPRSLQRRLTERKASFRALVDHVRCRRAVALLHAGSSLDQIAEHVGLSDERALRRALRRWTGRTARQVTRPAALAA